MREQVTTTIDRRRTIPVAAAVLAALLTAACGGGDEAATTNSTPTSASSSTAGPTPTASPGTSSATSVPVPTSTPGQDVEIRPTAGAVLSVIGVAHDDVLNVRSGPSTAFPVVATAANLADDVTATGRGRLVNRSVWFEVSHAGVTGWANGSFLAWHDGTDDVTSLVVNRLGSTPTAETMLDLGLEVAEAMVYGPEKAWIVVSVAPTVGDLGEVTYDVVGLSDDSVRALRLHVFGQPVASGEGFSLKSVEATSFCDRGVSDNGLCL